MNLKKRQEYEIRKAVEELKELASLKNCSLDEDTKEKMKSWVMWIDCYAIKIEKALNDDIEY